MMATSLRVVTTARATLLTATSMATTTTSQTGRARAQRAGYHPGVILVSYRFPTEFLLTAPTALCQYYLAEKLHNWHIVFSVRHTARSLQLVGMATRPQAIIQAISKHFSWPTGSSYSLHRFAGGGGGRASRGPTPEVGACHASLRWEGRAYRGLHPEVGACGASLRWEGRAY